MILIAHRGNLDGRIKKKENHPDYINKALKLNFNVEIDLFYFKKFLWLGHDRPSFKILNEKWLHNMSIWCHAKNIEALNYMLNFKKIHCFWHQKDDVTLTSKGIIWTYPNKEVHDKSVIVINKYIKKQDLPICMGVCSDYVIRYK